jgi:riboflavin kinase / FMN adenylyltransferase
VTVVGLGDLPAIGPAAITLGVFDGVHLGHRALIDATRQAAAERAARAVAIVFHPHPDEVLRPGTTVSRLLPPSETVARLTAAGADLVVELRFDDELRAMEPDAFLAALGPALRLRAVVMTPESAFGRARAGTLARVTAIGAGAGFDTVAVEPVEFGRVPVSSSRVRSALAQGDIAGATAMLAAPPLLRGIVVHGDRRGRELGFPTANLAFEYAAALPALGIYVGRVSVEGRGVPVRHPALVSVGVRPTFHDDGRVLVEVYLLDWEGDLYDATMTLEVEARLREERRFESVDALVTQMRADERDARRLLGLHGG